MFYRIALHCFNTKLKLVTVELFKQLECMHKKFLYKLRVLKKITSQHTSKFDLTFHFAFSANKIPKGLINCIGIFCTI